ncbi:MAG: integrase core domain-containing protein [Candidatus Omnitrophota bacterium]
MCPYAKKLFTHKWQTILLEYEKVKAKKSKHFKKVKDLMDAYGIHKRDLYKYYHRWVDGNRETESLFPRKRGPRYKTRRTLKPIERNIMKAYRQLGSPSYKIVELFKPYYGDLTPSVRTVDRIKARYPLNEKQKRQIKRYEKRYPGELGHMDSYYLPLEISMKRKYIMALADDCTRLCYAEVVDNLQSLTAGRFLFRAMHWFKNAYGFHYDKIMSDNGPEFKGAEDHPVELMLKDIGVEHMYTPPYYPQPNGKIEAFFKIVQTELIKAHRFKNLDEFKEQLGFYIQYYNHERSHGGIEYQTPFKKLEKVSKLLT